MNYENTNENTEKLDFNPKLPFGFILVIYILFMVSLILSLYLSIHISIISTENPSYSNAIKGVCSTSLLGTSIFYSRKLYKMSIGGRVNVIEKDEFTKFKLESLGSIIYFIVRPIYSVSFAIVIFLGVLSGAITILNNSEMITSNFIYFMMFISFFIGFSSGKFLEGLQDRSQKIIDSIWNSKEN